MALIWIDPSLARRGSSGGGGVGRHLRSWSRGVLGVVEALERVKSLDVLATLRLILV